MTLPTGTIEGRRTTRRGALEHHNPIALNRIRDFIRNMALGNPAFAIDTNFDIQTGAAIDYTNAGTLKTLASGADFDTGTAATIAGDQWGVALLSISAAGAGVVTWETNGGAGYATEAEAIAALPAVPSGNTPLGYVTVQAHANGFTAGTDALQGGTGGDPSPDTNYYNAIDPTARLAQFLENGSEIEA